MTTEKFIQGQMYELVDKDGFQNRSILHLPLVLDIMTTGKVIIPIVVDAFGNVSGIEFGDGTIDTTVRIWSACRQYFREVDPLPECVYAAIPPDIFNILLEDLPMEKEPLAA